MSELNLLETSYLASLLLASLVLPVLNSALGPTGNAKKTSFRIVCGGQLVVALCAVVLLFARAFALEATVFGLSVVMACASGLLCLSDKPVASKS